MTIWTRSAFPAATLLPVLLLAACGGDQSTAIEPPAKPPTSTATTPSPGETAEPAPGTAADGRDLDACRDAECEVVVREGDVLRFNDKADTAPLTVVSAGATFTITSSSGTTSMSGGGLIQTGSIQIEVGEHTENRTAIKISPRP